jgi:adenosylhomocysteine nucleosidase
LTTGVVGVVCALRSEGRHLGPIVSRHASVAALADGKLLTVAGTGGAAATLAADNLVAAGATALVSWGMAGGLDPALRAGQIFLPAQIVAADGMALATDARWREQVRAALAPRQPLSEGRLLTSPAAITSVAQKARLFHVTGAAAVDMESAAIARVAQAHGLPFIAVRVIVDVASDALPDSVRDAAGVTGKLKIGRLLARLCRRPQDVVPLTRLTRRYLEARRALAAIAHSGALAAQAPGLT